MYNRQSYNRGKYNVSAGSQQISGFVALAVTSEYAVGNVIYDAPKTAADIVTYSIGRQTSEVYAAKSVADVKISGDGYGIRGVFGSTDSGGEGGVDGISATITFSTSGEFSLGVYAETVDADIFVYTVGESVRSLFGVAPNAEVAVYTGGQMSRAVFAKVTDADLTVNSNGAGVRNVYTNGNQHAALALTASGSAALYGYAVISLPGLVLPPNGEIVIDTEQMTVTLNNQDVTRYFSPESEFFKLKPGENLVLYEDGVVNRDVSYKILWKDMYI